jgi:hypothetical protein
LKNILIVRKLSETEQIKLVDYVKAELGHSQTVAYAYGIEAAKHRLLSAAKLLGLVKQILLIASSLELLGPIKDKLNVCKRNVPIDQLSIRQAFARFATIQRALSELLQEFVMSCPETMTLITEHRFSLVTNDVRAVMSFLIRLSEGLSSTSPSYDSLRAQMLDLIKIDIAEALSYEQVAA